MSGQQDFVVFFDDFITGGAVPSTSAQSGLPWVIDDTSAAGTPTIAYTSPSKTGEIKLTMSSTNEATNLSLDFGDVLPLDVTKVRKFEARVKVSAILSSVETWAVGLVGNQSDTITTMTGVLVHVAGDGVSNKLICRTKNSSLTKTETTTYVMAADTWTTIKIDLSDWSDVKFYAGTDGNVDRIAKATVFDCSALTGGLQPILQIGKASGTTTTNTSADYFLVEGKR